MAALFRTRVDKNDKREIVLYRLGEMEYIPWEIHPKARQRLRVLTGTIVVDIGLDTHVIEQGGTFVIHRGQSHRASAVGPAVFMSTYTPPIMFDDDDDHAATYDILDADVPAVVRERERERALSF